MSRALTALLLMLAVGPAVAAPDALQSIDGCISRLDSNLDVGFDKIAAHCLDLAPGLARSPYGPWLPSDWNKPGNNLSVRGLEQLRALLVSESQRPAVSAGPETARVSAVLAVFTTAAAPPRGWWQRFKAWLRDLVASSDAPARQGWLPQLLEALGRHGTWVRLIALGALGVVALLAGAVVVRELRAAGLLRGPRRAARVGGAAGTAAAGAGGWRLIETASPAEQPRLLLELISARLAALERLPPARALTVHELLRAARLPHAGDRGRLAELAAACERLRYSGRRLPAESLAAALARGRELLEGLDAAPA
jgi:hypothetical protein